MEAFLDSIFNEMNLHKVKLTVFSFNKRAIKCYENCGFRQKVSIEKRYSGKEAIMT